MNEGADGSAGRPDRCGYGARALRGWLAGAGVNGSSTPLRKAEAVAEHDRRGLGEHRGRRGRCPLQRQRALGGGLGGGGAGGRGGRGVGAAACNAAWHRASSTAMSWRSLAVPRCIMRRRGS